MAVALHHGHQVRPDVAEYMALDEATRLREEDPYTGDWTTLAGHRVVVSHSRFVVDLNRPRESAVYLKPEDGWGLPIWKRPLPTEVLEASRSEYDAFYEEVFRLLAKVSGRHDLFVVYDLHSYNHRRRGPKEPPEGPVLSPQINLGTGSMERAYWAPVVESFLSHLGSLDFLGGRLDARENIKFVGRQFPKWVHETFPRQGCCLAVEVKKFFMDEWTGELYHEVHQAVGHALASTVPVVLDALGQIK